MKFKIREYKIFNIKIKFPSSNKALNKVASLMHSKKSGHFCERERVCVCIYVYICVFDLSLSMYMFALFLLGDGNFNEKHNNKKNHSRAPFLFRFHQLHSVFQSGGPIHLNYSQINPLYCFQTCYIYIPVYIALFKIVLRLLH